MLKTRREKSSLSVAAASVNLRRTGDNRLGRVRQPDPDKSTAVPIVLRSHLRLFWAAVDSFGEQGDLVVGPCDTGGQVGLVGFKQLDPDQRRRLEDSADLTLEVPLLDALQQAPRNAGPVSQILGRHAALLAGDSDLLAKQGRRMAGDPRVGAHCLSRHVSPKWFI
jgi:hypothetical protein